MDEFHSITWLLVITSNELLPLAAADAWNISNPGFFLLSGTPFNFYFRHSRRRNRWLLFGVNIIRCRQKFVFVFTTRVHYGNARVDHLYVKHYRCTVEFVKKDAILSQAKAMSQIFRISRK